jgi:hypothetical protein
VKALGPVADNTSLQLHRSGSAALTARVDSIVSGQRLLLR